MLVNNLMFNFYRENTFAIEFRVIGWVGGWLVRVVHSESHSIVLSGHMLIPLICNLGSILHWF